MKINAIVLLLEYIATMSCLYRLSKHKPILNKHNILGLGFNFICVLICMYYYNMGTKICGYICVICFAKYFYNFTWKDALKYFGLMAAVISSLQLGIYALFGNLILGTLEMSTVGIIENCILIIVFMSWKRTYSEAVIKTIIWLKEGIYIIIFFLFFFYLFYIRNEKNTLNPQSIMQTLLCLIGIILVAMLWLITEKEKKRKVEELRVYELYTKSFEETIAAIRMKQHEFKNHINAIVCMQYTIEDEEELKMTQMNYCQEILKDNSLNDLLKIKMSPVIVGYLYSKFAFAVEKGILVSYDIQDISLEERIAVHNLIEIIGILFDNAVEALSISEETEKKIYVKIGVNKSGTFFIEIANTSREYRFAEMAAFFEYGNSTKGEDRGIGLYQAKQIAEKNNGTISVENIVQDGMTYISFKVLFQ